MASGKPAERHPRDLLGLVALACLLLAAFQLEAQRGEVEVRPFAVGTTPASLFQLPDAAPGPVVVIAHGFAGSRQLMASYALTLARAGYRVVAFDFEGHGRNPVPMSGDVTAVEGTTQLLMAELGRVAEAALRLPGADGRLAYLGHSMASDIVVRQALEPPAVDATIAVSMFSRAVTATTPGNLLVIVGAWEQRLLEEALRALQLADPDARVGEIVGDPAAGTGRGVAVAPNVEHVGVLYSAAAQRAARDWLDASFRRASDAGIADRGGWIALLLVAVIVLGWPLAGRLPAAREAPSAPLTTGRLALATLAPAALTPLLLLPVETRILPVLIADYLVLHFALQGALVLALLGYWGRLRGAFPPRALAIALAVGLFGIGLFGTLVDRYVASFVPHAGRIAIVLGLALGAVPWMLADALLTEGGRAGVPRTLLVRSAMLGSLGLAVALDFEALFFLVIILPVILLFFLLFGTMGGWVGRRTGLPAASGLGLGLVLAWALGVTFPLFSP